MRVESFQYAGRRIPDLGFKPDSIVSTGEEKVPLGGVDEFQNTFEKKIAEEFAIRDRVIDLSDFVS